MRLSTKVRVRITELNMTPMIDVVFLLITFFLIVTDIAKQDEIEDLKLPFVKASKPDEASDPQRLVINILKSGEIYVGGNSVSDKQVFDFLAVEARMTRDTAGVSKRLVLVKADERTPYRYIRKIIAMCVDRHIRIWRLSFGTLPFSSESVAQAGAGQK
jgi:biopolymer transport protein ExbD